MLDPQTYRANEALAKQDPANKRRAEAHVVDHFERIGFPVRIYSTQEVRPLINSMQENRFHLYMDEMGGLTEQEYTSLRIACRAIISFQRIHFPQVKPVLPLSVLMSVLCLYKKILNIKPLRSILEIGPGCGYLPLFLCQYNGWVRYGQIEACESFYILQSLINSYCFGQKFKEHAFTPDASDIDHFWTPDGQFEAPPVVEFFDDASVCEHFPWWHIDKLKGRTHHVVTSNANLLEFTPSALDDYLGLIMDVLEPNGALLAQCCGSHVHGTPDQLFRKAEAVGLKLLAQPKFNNIHNALWVRQDYDPPSDLADRVFTKRPEKRREYTIQEIVYETMVGFK